MELTMSASLQEFRARLREFLTANAPEIEVRPGFRSPTSDEEQRLLRRWKAELYAAGYLGADWPVEFGGQTKRHPLEDFIVAEEMARANLPPLNDQTTLAADAIIRFGTNEQKQRFLPKIRSAEQIWSQLFSEPDAGSDLANISTKAAPTSDGRYALQGQKVWSTNAQFSDYGFLIARTEAGSQRHHGLSAFALDMSLPGIEVRPLREITGTSDFNEVFFDGVEIPEGSMLGAPGQGWRIALESLGAERTGIGAGAARLRSMHVDLVDMARRVTDNGQSVIDREDTRLELARLCAEVEAANLLAYARISREAHGEFNERDTPVGKLAFSELNLQIAEFALGLQGLRSLLVWGEPGAVDGGRWSEEYLYARTYTIAGGSSEIMRNLIAERDLGMPREARLDRAAER
jgi:alkylation response protein AidB-like acyl-CoA dehydrogenase